MKKRTKKRRIPLMTWTCAVFGGLLLAYPGMMVLVSLSPGGAAEKLIIPMILLPVAWSSASVWIFHSNNAHSACRKTLVSTLAAALAAMACYLIS